MVKFEQLYFGQVTIMVFPRRFNGTNPSDTPPDTEYVLSSLIRSISRGRRFVPLLLQSFGCDFKPRPHLRMIFVAGGRYTEFTHSLLSNLKRRYRNAAWIYIHELCKFNVILICFHWPSDFSFFISASLYYAVCFGKCMLNY